MSTMRKTRRGPIRHDHFSNSPSEIEKFMLVNFADCSLAWPLRLTKSCYQAMLGQSIPVPFGAINRRASRVASTPLNRSWSVATFGPQVSQPILRYFNCSATTTFCERLALHTVLA